MVDIVLMWGGVITVLAGVVTTLWHMVRATMRIGVRMDQFMDDWYGEPARPGTPARPGVLERVSGIEARLERVEHELYPNSGRSLRDAVDQANHRLSRLCREEHGEPEPPDEE